MRWKWQLLKLSSIWLFTIGIAVSAMMIIGMIDDGVRLGRSNVLFFSVFAFWIILLAFVHFTFVKSSKQLLQQASELKSFRIQVMLAALLLNLLLLAGWMIAGLMVVEAFSEADPDTHIATFVQVFVYTFLVSVALSVANYLIAINAYFELLHVRRKQQEDILHAIGNPHFQHHS
jgi:hypothetical protein